MVLLNISEIERVVRQRWVLPEKLLRTLPLLAVEIATSKGAEGDYVYKPRERLRAMGLLMEMFEQNNQEPELDSKPSPVGGRGIPSDTRTFILAMINTDRNIPLLEG